MVCSYLFFVRFLVGGIYYFSTFTLIRKQLILFSSSPLLTTISFYFSMFFFLNLQSECDHHIEMNTNQNLIRFIFVVAVKYVEKGGPFIRLDF